MSKISKMLVYFSGILFLFGPLANSSGNSENINLNRKELKNELIIAQAEKEALDSLKSLLAKKKNTPEEPDLLFRLAELNLRRTKTSRYFEYNKENAKQLMLQPQQNITASVEIILQQTLAFLERIEKVFPDFDQMGSVIFNQATIHLSLKNVKKSLEKFELVTKKYPTSPQFLDAHVAAGEILYEQGKFEMALTHFNSVAQFPASRPFLFALYKSAWSYYNIKNTEKAQSQLVIILENSRNEKNQKQSFNLKREAILDLALFFSESKSPKDSLSTMQALLKNEELAIALAQISKIYYSHGKYSDSIDAISLLNTHFPNEPKYFATQLTLINSLENKGLRSELLTVIEKLFSACKKESPNSRDENVASVCNEELPKLTSELNKNWIAEWKKKNTPETKEIARLFNTLIHGSDSEDRKIKMVLAYADFMFQAKNFLEAAKQYALAAELNKYNISSDEHIYSAIVSLEKQIELEKSTKGNSSVGKDENSIKKDSAIMIETFLNRFPKSKYYLEVQFKQGYNFYLEANLDNALAKLDLVRKSPENSLREKSEDLILDIYNKQNEFQKINDLILAIKQNNSISSTRIKYLEKIYEESHVAQTKNFAKDKSNPNSTLDKLVQGYKKNQKSFPILARESLWTAVSYAFENRLYFAGAILSEEFNRLYKDDKTQLERINKASKEATETYYNHGLLDRAHNLTAAKTGNSLKENLEVLALLNEENKAVTLVLENSKLLSNDHVLIGQLLELSERIKFSKLKKTLQDIALSMKMEPFFTEKKVIQVQELLESKKHNEAFNLAKPIINNKSLPADLRAKARFIQGQVLNFEFKQQKTKTSSQNFSKVLAIKLEKFTKAEESLNLALSMSQNKSLQEDILREIISSYEHMINTIQNPDLKNSLSSNELVSLKSELAAISTPLVTKKVAFANMLGSAGRQEIIAKTTNKDEKELDFKKSYSPTIDFKDIINATKEFDLLKGINYAHLIESKEIKCTETPDPTNQFLNTGILFSESKHASEKSFYEFISCLENNKPALARNHLYTFALRGGASVSVKIGLYFLVTHLNKPLWADWVISTLNNMKTEDPKTALDLHNIEMAEFVRTFKKLKMESQVITTEMVDVLAAFNNKKIQNKVTISATIAKAFANRKCNLVIETHNTAMKAFDNNFIAATIVSECLAQAGEIENAQKLLNQVETAHFSPEIEFQRARISEDYKVSFDEALDIYLKIQSRNSKELSSQTLAWLNQKVQYLQRLTGKQEVKTAKNESEAQ